GRPAGTARPRRLGPRRRARGGGPPGLRLVRRGRPDSPCDRAAAHRRRDANPNRAGALGADQRGRDPAQHQRWRDRLWPSGAARAGAAALPAQWARGAPRRRRRVSGPPAGDLDRGARPTDRHPGAVRRGAGTPRAQPGLVPAQHAGRVSPAPSRQLPPLRPGRVQQQQRALCL
ncbi:MAG: hypothetical protein AVDCRST_MAG88-1147, partial [uncultured Thermomicrobiales bacterium]